MTKDDLEFGEPSGLCYDCYMYEEQANNAEPEMRQITRDMASDACDMSLEGQWIEW
jgi:hypothetical protein